MNAGVRHFVLELYDTGTASLRESPYSLRKAFSAGKERGAHFYCTSQQEGIVDFSGYVTSHELWREGAIPMGALTTESAYTRLLAGLALLEDPAEVPAFMEEANCGAGCTGCGSWARSPSCCCATAPAWPSAWWMARRR
jgi:aspartyl-tRNA(Asn)/glutamyl-tRNA(Gln) amidotransferase subunit B